MPIEKIKITDPSAPLSAGLIKSTTLQTSKSLADWMDVVEQPGGALEQTPVKAKTSQTAKALEDWLDLVEQPVLDIDQVTDGAALKAGPAPIPPAGIRTTAYFKTPSQGNGQYALVLHQGNPESEYLQAKAADGRPVIDVYGLTNGTATYLRGVLSDVMVIRAVDAADDPWLSFGPPASRIPGRTMSVHGTMEANGGLFDSGSRVVVARSDSPGTQIRQIWRGSQAQYDAIASKDNATLYVIT
jgi:hypothetical protein